MFSNQQDVSHRTDITKRKMEADGSFNPKPATILHKIEKGGQFEPEEGRYLIYVSYACPFAHRALITRALKGLEDVIDIVVMSPCMGEQGWAFGNVNPYPYAQADPIMNAEYLKDIYLAAQPNYDGRFSVPVLFDRKLKTIVNNESSEIIRILNTAFNEFIPRDNAALDIYPEAFRDGIEKSHEWIFPTVNIGVYKAGFATSQSAYETAVRALFDSLDRIEGMLQLQQLRAQGREFFLVGDQLTESDIRLYTTMIRFDPVYHGHFKCNLRTIRDGYPLIHRWMQNLYWNHPAFKNTTNFDHMKMGYYWSQPHMNPTRVVPLGPVPNIRPL